MQGSTVVIRNEVIYVLILLLVFLEDIRGEGKFVQREIEITLANFGMSNNCSEVTTLHVKSRLQQQQVGGQDTCVAC